MYKPTFNLLKLCNNDLHLATRVVDRIIAGITTSDIQDIINSLIEEDICDIMDEDIRDFRQNEDLINEVAERNGTVGSTPTEV